MTHDKEGKRGADGSKEARGSIDVFDVASRQQQSKAPLKEIERSKKRGKANDKRGERRKCSRMVAKKLPRRAHESNPLPEPIDC